MGRDRRAVRGNRTDRLYLAQPWHLHQPDAHLPDRARGTRLSTRRHGTGQGGGDPAGCGCRADHRPRRGRKLSCAGQMRFRRHGAGADLRPALGQKGPVGRSRTHSALRGRQLVHVDDLCPGAGGLHSQPGGGPGAGIRRRHHHTNRHAAPRRRRRRRPCRSARRLDRRPARPSGDVVRGARQAWRTGAVLGEGREPPRTGCRGRLADRPPCRGRGRTSSGHNSHRGRPVGVRCRHCRNRLDRVETRLDHAPP